jgi:hypothetical protein
MKAYEVRPVVRSPRGTTWIVVCAEDGGKFLPSAGTQEHATKEEAQAEADRLGGVEFAKP